MHEFFAHFIPLASIFLMRILLPLAITIGFAIFLKRIEAKWSEQ